MEQLEKELASPRFFWTQADVTDSASLQEWQEEMRSRSFAPDCLVLNASILRDDLGPSYDHETGKAVLRTNLEGALHCIALFLPAFLERGSGSIIAIGSTAMLRPSVRSAAYAASKAGLALAMRSLRLRYGQQGIRFEQALLGPIDTEMWEGKRGILVPSPSRAARAIAGFISSKRATLYYPRISTALLRASLWLPDAAFASASNRLFK